MNDRTLTRPEDPRARWRGLLDHPRGLWVLTGTELWERISFHGMQALLTLYMAEQLLLPGHIGHVIGFATFRGVDRRAKRTPLAG